MVFGRCEATSGIEPFTRLVADGMTTEPYVSARRVFWVVDNGSSHRGKATCDRLQAAHPNDLTDLDAVEARLLAFQNYYEQIATPFEWKFTRADLRRVLDRTARLDLPQAA